MDRLALHQRIKFEFYLNKVIKAAKAFRGKVEQPQHKYVPGSASITVKDAAERWLLAVEHGSRQSAPEPVEDATLRQYTYHVRQYIEPQLGNAKVSTLAKRQ